MWDKLIAARVHFRQVRGTLGLLVFQWLRGPMPDSSGEVRRFSISLANVSPPVVSPNGRHIVFAVEEGAENALWVRELDHETARKLKGTEGVAYDTGVGLFWSLDSRFVGFEEAGS